MFRSFFILCRIVLGLPKSLYLNFRVFPIRVALQIPILVSWKTSISVCRGAITIESSRIKFGMMKVGIIHNSAGLLYANECFIGIDKISKLVVRGPITMAPGATIKVINGGKLIVGSDCSFNFHCTILCKKMIAIGNKVLFGWDIMLNDGDGHSIYNEKGEIINDNKPIIIEDGVWIGSKANLLKGTKISKGSIVGCGSIVTAKFEKSHVIIAGNPAKVIKENVKWSS